MFIQAVTTNLDNAFYLAWLEDGNVEFDMKEDIVMFNYGHLNCNMKRKIP